MAKMKSRKLTSYFIRFAAGFCMMTLLALMITIALYIFAQMEWIRSRIGEPIIGFVVLFVVLFICGAVILSTRFSRQLGQRLAPLTDATQRIKIHDLEFTMPHSDIIEIDDVLCSMDDMKDALKASLQTQWQLEQARTEQLAALTHDIQTPLTIIRGNAELLNQVAEAGKPKQYSEFILQGALRLEQYVQEMNHLASKEDADMTPCGTGQLYNDLVAGLAALCVAKQIIVIRSDAVLDVKVNVCRARLLRAFSSVFDNAVRYTQNGGRIRFELHLIGEYIVFSIEDGGPGFSNEALLKAKEQFYSEKENAAGHGLGLATCDSIIQMHKGLLHIENTHSPCHGKVSVQLPIIADADRIVGQFD